MQPDNIFVSPPRELPPLAVSPRDAARLLGVSEPTLARLGIPSVKLHGRRLYRVVTLDEWLRQQEQKPN